MFLNFAKITKIVQYENTCNTFILSYSLFSGIFRKFAFDYYLAVFYMRRILIIICAALLCLTVISCGKDDDTLPVEDYNARTLLMYMPWSSNLTDDFRHNISDMEKSISKNGLTNEKVVVFFATSPNEAEMFEICCNNGICERKTLKRYASPACTTAAGITAILNDMKAFAPAETYSMTIGCHGMGWIPVNATRGTDCVASRMMHWDYEGVPKTRYFGGTSARYQTDISTLAEGIEDAGIRMEYILFDDCYMASVEVAFELKDVTNYLIGSTSEIMAYGMPYETMGRHLLGRPNYQAICETFHDFYSSYEDMPCGTISVTDCSQLDNLALIMKEINTRYAFDSSLSSSLQCLDGYRPTLFYDLGDYVSHLCGDPALLQAFNDRLSRAVPYKAHTDFFYSMSSGKIPINTFSGITISDPSQNSLATTKTNTKWYKATH